VLRVLDARKSYGSTVALAGCSLELQPREWLGLLGPNGAGKTTLIRAIGGRVRLDAGSVDLFGTTLSGDAHSDRAARSRLGVVPQEIALYPTLSARENLQVFGRLRGVAGAKLADRITWALEFSGLEDRADDRASSFSGGMKRRLNIACGVLHRPEIILLDEPTVGVDPQSRQRIWEMLDALRDDGAALLLTTHQLDEAQRLCDRIAIIDHGQTIASGTLRELITSTIGPQHDVVLRLDAAPSCREALPQFAIDGRTLTARIDDVARDLPGMLAAVAASGRRVEDVHLASPTLHAVFIALTGRELRE
jgi:ABC-2 type transport system ATP-binding protein